MVSAAGSLRIEAGFLASLADPRGAIRPSAYVAAAVLSFLSLDAAREFANPYAYVGWDPINATDPTGECVAICLLIAVGIAFVAGFMAGVVAGFTAPIMGGLLEPLAGGMAGFYGGTVGLGETASSVATAMTLGGPSAVYGLTQGDYAGAIGLGIGIGIMVSGRGALAPGGSGATERGTLSDVAGKATAHGYQEVSAARDVGFRPSMNDFKIQHAATSWKGVTELATWMTGAERSPIHYLGRLLALPAVAMVGVGYEIQTAIGPLNSAGRYFDQQGLVDWLWDTPGDLVGNAVGLMTSAAPVPDGWATTVMRYTAQLIPGPNHIGGHVCADYRCVSAPGGPNGVPY